ncbi:MAG: ion channel [Candidatus Auribacterota bacterium]
MKKFIDWHKELKNRYNHLLSILSIILLLYPLINAIEIRLPIINFFLILAIMPALYTALKPKTFRYFSLMLMGCFLIDILIAYNVLSDNSLLFLFTIVIYAVLLSIAIIALIRKINSFRTVTPDVIKGGISIYLLLGVLWMVLYNILNTFAPDAFSCGSGQSIDFIYLSFITLTTLGYGDIVPLTPVSKILTTFEAITGQIFLATLIARLVGLKIAQELKQEEKL